MVDWSMLPGDLLQIIADLLFPVDYIRFRAVCISWRSVAPDPPAQLPWLMLTFDEITDVRSFFSLSDRKIIILHLPEVAGKRIVGSTDGWLVLVDDSSNICLFDPLSRVKIDLPPLMTLSQMIEYREEDVGNEYTIEYEPGERVVGTFDSDTVKDLFVSKMLIITSERSSNDLFTVLGFGFLGLFSATLGDDSWTTIDFGDTAFTDVLCYRGDIYVIGVPGVLMSCDLGPPAKLTPITPRRIAEYEDGLRWYLVESGGDLLAVARYWARGSHYSVYGTAKFEVFKIEIANGDPKITKVESLGDQMLFLGSNNSMSFSAKDYPGWKENSINFTACEFEECRFGFDPEPSYTGTDFGVFYLEDGRIESLNHCPDNSKFVWPPPIWFLPRIHHREAA